MRITLITVATLTAACVLAGCSSRGFGNIPSELEESPAVNPVEPPILPADDSDVSDTLVDPTWSCYYDPTYNTDWHDDVLCADGLDVQRPYLLEGDDFVTEDEIMAAAFAYETELNANR